MQTTIFEKSLEVLNKNTASTSQSLSMIAKSKMDKAQARRLKMPKRNRSAYFLFSMDVRAKLKAEIGVHLTPLETQAKVSQEWRDLNAEEKEKYENRAKEEKLEYLVAMEKFYSGLTPESLAKSKTNRPKKPCSAYAHFVRDIKTDLKKENPRLIMQEVLHIASDKWKNLAEDVRSVYESKAKIDKEQYMAQTRKTAAEECESAKKKKQESEKLGKRSIKFDDEKQVTKQLKSETFSVKSESMTDVEKTACTSIKIEDHKEVSTASSGSPLTTKIDIEGEHDVMDKLKLNLSYQPQLFNFNDNLLTSETNLPKFNLEFGQGFNGVQGLNLNNGYDKLREVMLSRLSMVRLAQAQRKFEEQIMRRVIEVKTLQAQRLMLAREVFLATNAGTF